jgi:hypothetical protein
MKRTAEEIERGVGRKAAHTSARGESMTDYVDDPALAVDQAEGPTDGEVRSIATLARELKALEGEIANDTAALQVKLTRYHQLSGIDLPNSLRQAGISGFQLADGSPVALKTSYDGTKLTTPEGLRWVEDNGGGSLIKTAIVLVMDRGDLPAAREILALLRANRHANRFTSLALTEEVHPQTVAKFVREQIEARKDPPLALLGVHRRTYTTVGDAPRRLELKGFAKR